MITTIHVKTLKDLLDRLEKFSNKKYIYRGHSNSEYKLIPTVFRKIQQGADSSYPVKSYSDWIDRKEVKKCMEDTYAKGVFSQYQKAYLPRFFYIIFFIMKHNYNIANFIKNNDIYLDQITLDKFKLQNINYWESYETFLYLLGSMIMPLLARTDLKGNVLNYSNLTDDFTGFDDTLPQHYGIPTSVLDWSYNPYIALFFALNNGFTGETLSLWLFEEFSGHNSPIEKIEIFPDNRNLRVQRQEGLFTRFTCANLYYFLRGEWPSVECFAGQFGHKFKLIKININNSINTELSKFISNKGLTLDYLLPKLK